VTLDHAQDHARADQLRQAAALEHIHNYYRLPERLGVRLAIGARVRFEGAEGQITDTFGHYLMVLLDGQSHPVKVHPTASMAYLTSSGWITATPLPDPVY